MRALFLENHIDKDETICIDGVKAHHLLNVVRVKDGEKILGLDGNGYKYILNITEVKKRNLTLKCDEKVFVDPCKTQYDLADCLTKKEAFENVLKSAVELGVQNIFVLESEFSQRYKLNKEKIHKQLISALEQSNNPYLPNISFLKLNEISLNEYDEAIYFSSIEGKDTFIGKGSERFLAIIGPEGGLSQVEEDFLRKNENLKAIKLPTAIMRTPTAVSCAFGYMLARI